MLRRLVAERQIKLGAYQYEISNQFSKAKCNQHLISPFVNADEYHLLKYAVSSDVSNENTAPLLFILFEEHLIVRKEKAVITQFRGNLHLHTRKNGTDAKGWYTVFVGVQG